LRGNIKGLAARISVCAANAGPTNRSPSRLLAWSAERQKSIYSPVMRHWDKVIDKNMKTIYYEYNMKNIIIVVMLFFSISLYADGIKIADHADPEYGFLFDVFRDFSPSEDVYRNNIHVYIEPGPLWPDEIVYTTLLVYKDTLLHEVIELKNFDKILQYTIGEIKMFIINSDKDIFNEYAILLDYTGFENPVELLLIDDEHANYKILDSMSCPFFKDKLLPFVSNEYGDKMVHFRNASAYNFFSLYDYGNQTGFTKYLRIYEISNNKINTIFTDWYYYQTFFEYFEENNLYLKAKDIYKRQSGQEEDVILSYLKQYQFDMTRSEIIAFENINLIKNLHTGCVSDIESKLLELQQNIRYYKWNHGNNRYDIIRTDVYKYYDIDFSLYWQ
jgi:hypothetical protein